MKLLEFNTDTKNIDFKREGRRIPRHEIKLLYHLNYWDGPLSGICSWNDKRYYFVCSLEEGLVVEVEPGDDEYIDPSISFPPEWEWAKKYYKSMAEIEDLNQHYYNCRYMVLYELTPEEWEAEDKKHAAWRKYIGRHTDYAENGQRPVGEVGSEEGGPCNWEAFKEATANLPERPKKLEREDKGYFILWINDLIWQLAQEPEKVKRIKMPKKRKPGEWVSLSSNQGFVGDSDRLRVQILEESDPPPSMEICCETGERCGGREWSNLMTEPDPLNNGKRHLLCHVCECQMSDCEAEDLKNVLCPPASEL